jgi:hypothetical protein
MSIGLLDAAAAFFEVPTSDCLAFFLAGCWPKFRGFESESLYILGTTGVIFVIFAVFLSVVDALRFCGTVDGLAGGDELLARSAPRTGRVTMFEGPTDAVAAPDDVG